MNRKPVSVFMECGDLSPLLTAGLVTPLSAATGLLRADKSARQKR